MGFLAFGASGIMGILSIILFFQSLMSSDETEVSVSPFADIMLLRISSVLGVILLYIFFLKPLGYLVDTFLLMSILFIIVGLRKWWQVIPFSAVISIATYFLFYKIFSCPFPPGLLSF